MLSRAQWWFVMIRPFGDTNEAEQPPPNRSEARRSEFNHFWSGLNPYSFSR